MSSKIVNVSSVEIKKSFTSGTVTRVSQRCKADFKLKRFADAKTEFGVSTLCASTVFGLGGLKD